MWVMFIGMVVVCFDGSFIARYFTRFVQDIFAAMIALLFIFDALNNLVKVCGLILNFNNFYVLLRL